MQLAYNLQTGEQCAIKFIERGIQMQRIVARELLNHRMCALHPHIVQLKVGMHMVDVRTTSGDLPPASMRRWHLHVADDVVQIPMLPHCYFVSMSPATGSRPQLSVALPTAARLTVLFKMLIA